MLDFNILMMRHDESLIQQLVETWERYNDVCHEHPMMLEERWNYFIRCTDAPASVAM